VNGINDALPNAGSREHDDEVIDQLKETFCSYGDVQKVTYRGLNYAFIDYVSKEGSDAAVAGGDIQFGEATLVVEARKPKEKREAFVPQGPNTSIYVKGIPEDCTDEAVQAAFEGYGTITRIFNKSDRGYAFVAFDTAEEMNAAIAATGINVGGSEVEIEEERKHKRRSAPAPSHGHSHGDKPCNGDH
jgi:hypothetical protein